MFDIFHKIYLQIITICQIFGIKKLRPTLSISVIIKFILIILTILIIFQSVVFFMRFTIEKIISREITYRMDAIKNDGYKFTFENMRSFVGFLNSGVTIDNVKIASNKNNSYIKSNKMIISCNIFSCLTGRFTISPDVSVEFKLNSYPDVLFISFSQYPKISLKANKDEIYVYYNMKNGVIFNLHTQKQIASFNKIYLMFNQWIDGKLRKTKLITTIDAKNLFNLDYSMGNDKSIYIDTGNLYFNIDFFSKIINNTDKLPDIFDIKLYNIKLKTSSFKIEGNGEIKSKDKHIDVNIDLYFGKYKNFLDYIGTLLLNATSDYSTQKITKIVIPYLADNFFPSISDNDNAKIHIQNKAKSNEIYINKRPLSFMLTDFYQQNVS